MIITCPSCEARLRVPDKAAGRVLPCPKCHSRIDTSKVGRPTEVETATGSTWFYMKEGWLQDKEMGPVSEDVFLSLIRQRQIKKMSLVRSPEFTANKWQNLQHISIAKLQAGQRIRREKVQQAELERLKRARIKQENLERIRTIIQEAIADGRISQSERSTIDQFAKSAELDRHEVQHILQVEGKRLIARLVAEALEDGVLTPEEESTIERFSAGLGIPLELDPHTEELIELSRLCWLFDSCDLEEFPTIDVSFHLQARERCFAQHCVEWNTISQRSSSNRSTSSPLKPVGEGEIFVTNKRLVFMTALDSKSVRHTSIAKVEGFRDGILLVRSTGSSVFLRFVEGSRLENQKLALLVQRVCLERPGTFRASFPADSFTGQMTEDVDEVIVAETVGSLGGNGHIPRFTFRVVGTNHGNRRRFADAMRVGDPLRLAREPDNPADPNAVAVFDQNGHQLGYLKREVAEWFGPKLDCGEYYTADVFRIRDNGALIAGVYEE